MSTPTSSSLKRPLPSVGAAAAAAAAAAAPPPPSNAASSHASNNPSTPLNNVGAGTTPRSVVATPGGGHGSAGGAPGGFRSPAASRAALGRSPKPPIGTPSTQFSGSGRQHAVTGGKSVAAAAATAGSGSGMAGHSSPMAAVGTPGLFASGGGNMAGIASPGLPEGLGMNISMSSMGIAMGLSSSSLGMGMASASSLGFNRISDEERRRRLEAVLLALGQRTGHVSQQGLEHLGKRLGLEPGWEIFPEAKVGAGRMLSFAGGSIQVDVEFSEKPGQTDSVTRAALTYHGLDGAIDEGSRDAGRIMQRDLTPAKGQAPITLTLDRFAANLERLSRLDKLSVSGSSCFEAIHGVYTSLKRLYEHEKEAARTLLGDVTDEDRLDTHVMCSKSGSPKLHARRHLGVQLDYWQSHHLVPRPGRDRETVVVKKEQDTPMDIDSIGDASDSKTKDEDNEDADLGTTYSLSIECEQSPLGMYQTIRTSTQWISDRVERLPDEVESAMADASQTSLPVDQLDWLEPAVPQPGTETVPSRARFVAKFYPPLLVPSKIAMPILASVGVDVSHEVSNMAWHSAVLERLDAALPAAGTPFRQSVSKKTGRAGDQEWRLNLTVPRAEPARVLDALPFSHPKQLVSLLPVLRQYAFFGELLRNTYDVGKPKVDSDPATPGLGNFAKTDDAKAQTSDQEDIDSFMADSDEEDTAMTDATDQSQNSLDVTLRTDGLAGPRLLLAMPNTRTKGVSYLDIDIVPGGTAVVSTGSQRTSSVDEKKQTAAETAMAKALMVAEDLGTWASWARDSALPKLP